VTEANPFYGRARPVALSLLKHRVVAPKVGDGSEDTRMANIFRHLSFSNPLAAIGAWLVRYADTDHAAVEAAESGPTLQAVVEHSTNLFYTHTPDHLMTYVSPQSRTMLDCEPEEALRHWTTWLTDNPVNAKGVDATEAAIRTGSRQPAYELELRTKTGRIVWVEVNEAPIVEGGQCVQVVGALTDITERKRADRERERLHEQLRQAHKMEAVGRLAGGVAHDFNNLLGVITGYAEILEREGDPSVAPKVEQILKASERAASLTRQLLTFSRRQILDPKVLDLSNVVRDMEKMLRRLIGEDVRLEVAAPAGLGTIRADPGQLEQVLMNLAVNARDAMPGGGSLKVVVDGAVIDEGQSRDVPAGRYVRLSVTDSGEGIEADALPHIFEPFFTTKEKGKGTGLGLATVYAIVQQSGGAIVVESRPGHGTTFRVYLPRRDEAPSTRHDTHAATAPVGGTGTVLVVEDDDTLRSIIGMMLRDSGYTVLEASGGPQALSLAERHPAAIDVVLTDVVMPGLNGRQLCEMLATRRTGVAVIYMSGYTDEVLERNGVLEGGAVLHKPFTTAALLEIVHRAMATRRSAPVVPVALPALAASWPHRRAWNGAAISPA
jgi:two-component system, cell cycle sensor histidine kinase and response regulator CckA